MDSDLPSASIRRPPLSESANEIRVLICFLVVLSVVTFVAATFPLDRVWCDRLRVIDGGIAVVFLVEYGVRFWWADRKLTFVCSLLSTIDAIVLLELMASLGGVPIVHGLRGMRALRLLRFLDVDVALFRIESRDRIIFARIIFTLIAIVSLFAGLIYEVEHTVNPEDFGTVLDAIYFAVVTMTTVGFGDMTPATSAGRLLTVLMILTGVALIPWQIGQLIEQMVKSWQRISIICMTCGCNRHDRDANFCKQCGAALNLFDAKPNVSPVHLHPNLSPIQNRRDDLDDSQ